jgi:hypothetical protein
MRDKYYRAYGCLEQRGSSYFNHGVSFRPLLDGNIQIPGTSLQRRFRGVLRTVSRAPYGPLAGAHFTLPPSPRLLGVVPCDWPAAGDRLDRQSRVAYS